MADVVHEVEDMNRRWGITPDPTPDPAGRVPPQLAKTSNDIGRRLAAIEDGTSPRGEHPGLERLLGGAGRSNRVRRPRLQRQEFISDVSPVMRERIAVNEYRVKSLEKDFDNHRAESIRASAAYATQEQVAALQRGFDRLATMSTIKTVTVVISTAGSVLLIAWYALNLGSRLHL
jgi:hypothetical protein